MSIDANDIGCDELQECCIYYFPICFQHIAKQHIAQQLMISAHNWISYTLDTIAKRGKNDIIVPSTSSGAIATLTTSVSVEPVSINEMVFVQSQAKYCS